MPLLTQNSKMQKTDNSAIAVWNWTIRAGVSCPYAGACNKPGKCYAQSGAYQFGNVRRKHEANLELTRDSAAFQAVMTAELKRLGARLKKQGKQLVVRIHDAGDFYSLEYLHAWCQIIKQFPDMVFYCYTKSVPLLKRLGGIPPNFLVNYSMGGTKDSLVNTELDRHVHIFDSEESLLAAGYTRNDDTDSLAFSPDVRRIGLVARWGIASTWPGSLKEKSA